MYYVFIFIMLGAIGYFLFAKRVFDFFSIAIFAGCFYFLPGLFGHAYNPYLNILDALTATQYGIFIVYFSLFSVGAILKDRLFLKEKELAFAFASGWSEANDKLKAVDNSTILGKKSRFSALRYSHTSLYASLRCAKDKLFCLRLANCQQFLNNPLDLFISIILGIIYVFSFLYLVYSLGGNAFSSDKLAIMNQLGTEFSVFCSSALIGVVFWYKRSKVLFMLTVLGLLYTLFISYRFIFVLGLLSFAMLYFSRQGQQRLFFNNWKMLVFIAAIGVFLFTYEYMFVSYKTFSINVIIKNIMINIYNYQRLFIHAEPMVIQENLNLAIKNNYHVSPHYLLNNLILFFVPFSSKMGLQATSFNQLFQPVFYSGYQYGVAANIWAEMYAVGGLKLVYIFMLLLTTLCFGMSIKVKQLSHNVAALVIPIGIIFFFYIQRNDLTFTLNMARNVFLIWGFANIVSYGIVKVKQKISGSR